MSKVRAFFLFRNPTLLGRKMTGKGVMIVIRATGEFGSRWEDKGDIRELVLRLVEQVSGLWVSWGNHFVNG